MSRASNSEQVPWVASSLSDDFYFGPSRPGATTSARPSVTPSQPAPPPPQVSTPAPAPAPPPARSQPQPQPQPAPSAALTQPQAPTRAGSRAGDSFRDCPDCPELVVVPAGSFNMGSASEYENPIYRVTIAKSYAIGRREVTFDHGIAASMPGAADIAPTIGIGYAASDRLSMSAGTMRRRS